MFDIVSYVLGRQKGIDVGTNHVELDSDNLTFTDDGEGNITITTEG